MAEGGWTELAAGAEFAGYRIERLLGRGGMGVLYLAEEPSLGRRVALKLIAPEVAAEEVFARRFAEESRIAAAIEHPNVVPIYAAGEEAGVPYIAMRFVAGSDLGRRLAREGRLPAAEAVGLIAQVGDGLDAIHAGGLVHRDVKPANVLLGGEPGAQHAYITDFGVARNVATESGLTQTGRFVGTLDYVAPEQISGARIDARVDVYALGCLLHKLLTGVVPFPRDSDAARLYAHLNDPPPVPSRLVRELPAALDRVVARALAKSPEDRYPSAGDLGRAAEAALRGTAVALPERTVATGAAATVEAETADPAEPGEEAPAAPAATSATPRLRPEPAEPLTDPAPDGPRRRPLLIGAGLAAIVAVAVVALVLGSDGDGGAERTTTAGAQTASTSTRGQASRPGGIEERRRLSRSELIDRADRICERSQAGYTAIRDLDREFSADAPYARALVELARPRIDGLRELVPPAALEQAYGEYVAAHERVLRTDRQALEAARRGDAAGVRAARERRDDEDALREELARRIGFEVCSTPSNREGAR